MAREALAQYDASAQSAQAPASDDARQIEDLPPDEQLAVLRRNRERLSAMGVVFQTEEDLQRIGNSPALPAPGALAGLVESVRILFNAVEAHHNARGGASRDAVGTWYTLLARTVPKLEAAIRAGGEPIDLHPKYAAELVTAREAIKRLTADVEHFKAKAEQHRQDHSEQARMHAETVWQQDMLDEEVKALRQQLVAKDAEHVKLLRDWTTAQSWRDSVEDEWKAIQELLHCQHSDDLRHAVVKLIDDRDALRGRLKSAVELLTEARAWNIDEKYGAIIDRIDALLASEQRSDAGAM
jgi:hypothetical protein